MLSKESNINTPLGEVKIVAESNSNLFLTTGELPHTISNGMTIDCSIACVLKVMPGNELTNISFSGSLIGSDLIGGAATGECLDCIEWANNEWHLTLGTEDSEVLERRLPNINIILEPYSIEYTASQMKLNLKDLKITEAITFHLIISYKKLPDPRECSAWFFADMDHEVVNKAVKIDI